MSSTCLITDSSAQFSFPGFPGNKGLKILQHQIIYSYAGKVQANFPRVPEFPVVSNTDHHFSFVSPSPDSTISVLADVIPHFDDVFILLLSKELNPLYNETEKIAATLHGHANIHLIDSQNTSLGLGLLVQYAAELVTKGLDAKEIEKRLRLAAPHLYSVFCTPNLSYLHSAGLLDSGQETVGEMLGLYPLFVMEEGKLNPLQKVKSAHAAFEYFIEFIDEFDSLKHVGVIQPANSAFSESKMLHQHVDEFFPDTNYTEHMINPFMASLFGPRGFGMVVMENVDRYS